MIHQVKIFDFVEEGLIELYRMLCHTQRPSAREQIFHVIDAIEAGDKRARFFIWINDDGSISPLVIGGNRRQREQMREELRTNLQIAVNQSIH